MFEEKYKEWILKGFGGAINLLQHMVLDGILTAEEKVIVTKILHQNQIAQHNNPFFDMVKMLYDQCKLQVFNAEELKSYNTYLERLQGYGR